MPETLNYRSNSAQGQPQGRTINGIAVLVNMFRHLDPVSRKKLHGRLAGANLLYAKLVDQFEFIYNDLLRLEDESLNVLWEKIPEKSWLLAWKLSNQPMKQFFLRNLPASKRKAFYQQAEAQPKVHRKIVVRTQAEIAAEALKMLRMGKLKMRSKVRIPAKSNLPAAS